MSDPAAAELGAALAELEGRARAGRAPDRYVARAVLVPLGRLVAAGATQGWVERARRAGEAAGAGWPEAVRAEVSLACAEHVHSVDPRYLDLPNYDLAYTRAARERLQARLAAAEALGVEVPAALLEGVRRADELLAERFGEPPA